MWISWWRRLKYKYLILARIETDYHTGQKTLTIVPKNTFIDAVEGAQYVVILSVIPL